MKKTYEKYILQRRNLLQRTLSVQFKGSCTSCIKKKSKKVIYLAMNWWIYASIGRNEIYHNIQSCGSDKGFLFWYDVLLPSGQR